MPVYNPALKPLNLSEIKRYSGLDQYAEFPSELIDQACTESYLLVQPQATWQIYDYDANTATIMGSPPLTLHAPKIINYLSQAIQIAVIGLTIGPKLEQKVSNYFSNGEYTSGLLLDAAGTTAVEVAADQVCDFIKNQAMRQGYLTLPRFSPGYGGWDITVQPLILDLANGDAINLKVTESCMLLPRKSITAVIGITAHQHDTNVGYMYQDTTCPQCTQINCLARKD
ncbi:methionine synthase [Pelosinus sp. sgz500959]|uniref:methionine synthase n=1 Tax=Pelosinus sp. sgz500959 TaxID=3242472 RepID=UPI00366A68DB